MVKIVETCRSVSCFATTAPARLCLTHWPAGLPACRRAAQGRATTSIVWLSCRRTAQVRAVKRARIAWWLPDSATQARQGRQAKSTSVKVDNETESRGCRMEKYFLERPGQSCQPDRSAHRARLNELLLAQATSRSEGICRVQEGYGDGPQRLGKPTIGW